jgi:prepilin-type N-terminal cleavage/methylation domain-containing protein
MSGSESWDRRSALRAAGFSLLELMVVVLIIGIVSAIALLNGRRVNELAREQLAQAKLNQLAEIQTQFRVALGHHRYGSLAELRAAQTGSGPLMSALLAPVDPGGNPVPSGGWIIQEQTPPSALVLSTSFALEAVPAPGVSAANRYCIFEDGALRSAPVNLDCTRSSTLVQ